MTVPLSEICFKDNIRLEVETAHSSLSPLMSNIKQNGLLQSVGIAIDTKQNEIILVHGHRRFEACKKLGHKTIETKIIGINLTDEEFSSINLSENFHREDNSVMEMGRVFKKQRDEFNMNISEIAARNSMPRSTVKVALNLYEKIPEEYMRDIVFSKPGAKKDGKISSGAATAIVSRRGLTKKERGHLLHATKRDELTSHKIEVIAKLKDGGLNIKQAIKKSDEYVIKSADVLVTKKGYLKVKEMYPSWASYVKKVLSGEVAPDTSLFED
jgi:ParB/RepB/Spo0J family partition protein